jgi:hypothetical protein
MSRDIFIRLPSVFKIGGVRVGGPGLGNLLFVISRGYVESIKNGCGIYPVPLIQIKPGAIVRQENDFRTYWNIVFKDPKNNKTQHLKVLLYLLFGPSALSWLANACSNMENKVTVVSGLGGYFNDYLGYDDKVRSFINANIEHALFGLKNDVNKSFKADLNVEYGVVHIRKGDFVDIWQADDDWYVKGLRFALSNIYKVNRVYIITDDLNKSEEIINMCKREFKASSIFYGEALECLHLMSKAEFVVGNNSTFSAWGSYLGSGRLVSQFVCSYLHPDPKSHLKIDIVG